MNHLEKHHGRTYVIPDDELVEDEDLVDEILEPRTGFWHTVRSIFVSDKKIGELNGKWAAMLKMVLILVMLTAPTILIWATWVTSNIYTIKNHLSQTEDYGNRLVNLETNMRILERVEKEIGKISVKVDDFPPMEWRRRIDLLEVGTEKVNIKLDDIDKTNSSEHNSIKLLVESIKTKLDMLSNGKQP